MLCSFTMTIKGHIDFTAPAGIALRRDALPAGSWRSWGDRLSDRLCRLHFISGIILRRIKGLFKDLNGLSRLANYIYTNIWIRIDQNGCRR